MYCYTTHDEHRIQLLIYQFFAIIAVIVAGFGVLAIEHFWPNFYNYPYFSWNVRWDAILNFWPLFVYCLVLATLAIVLEGNHEKRSSFTLGVITSILAGTWEEVAYRCIFVCYSMILIVWSNFLFSTVAGTVIGLVLLVGPLFFFERDAVAQSIFAAIVMVIGGGVLYFTWGVGADPVFWLYREIIVPFINFITFGQFRGIFHNGYPELFLFGLVSANGWFRSGHEYQGWYGMLNSWIIGFVLMYAMLHYGLLTAVALHILYDIQIDIIRFILGR